MSWRMFEISDFMDWQISIFFGLMNERCLKKINLLFGKFWKFWNYNLAHFKKILIHYLENYRSIRNLWIGEFRYFLDI